MEHAARLLVFDLDGTLVDSKEDLANAVNVAIESFDLPPLPHPTIALAVAVNILWTGWQLMRRSTAGLMDISLPDAELKAIGAVLDRYRAQGLEFHALRTRQAGTRGFVSLHVLVPGGWTVQQGHDWSERIEADIRAAVPHAHVTTHLEPQEDPISHADQLLDR